MKDENIKEILDFKEDADYKRLSVDEIVILKDYITNQQEGYEKEHYLVDKLTRQLTDEYKNTEYQCKQKEDYKSRIDKAIEYVKEEMPYLQETDEEFEDINGKSYVTYKEWNDSELLNILQGSDKDEFQENVNR